MKTNYKAPDKVRKKLGLIKTLNGRTLSESTINHIMSEFWIIDMYDSIVFQEPFQEIFLNFVKEQPKPESIHRLDFYQYLFTNEHNKESLERLALLMEERETNQLNTKTVEKFVFQKQSHSNLIGDSEKGIFTFTHHSIQEFLAATYILKHYNKKEIHDLILFSDDYISGIKPSWTNTVRFLIELNPSLITDILKYSKSSKFLTDDTFYNILFSTSTDSLNTELRTEMFYELYNKYQYEKKVWFPDWVSLTIGNFISENELLFLEEEFTKSLGLKDFLMLGNIVRSIRSLVKNDINLYQNHKDFWNREIINLLQNKDLNRNEFSVARRNALDIITEIKDEKLFAQLTEDFITHEGDFLVKENYLEAAYTINPDAQATAELLVKYINSENIGLSVRARYGIAHLQGGASFMKFFDSLEGSVDNMKIYRFLEHDRLEDEFFKNLEQALDETLYGKVKEFIFFLLEKIYTSNKYEFTKKISRILYKYDKKFLNELLDHVDSQFTFWEYSNIFSYLINKSNFKTIFHLFDNQEFLDSKDKISFIQLLKSQKSIKTNDIPEEYKDDWRQAMILSPKEKKLEQDKRIYEEFQKLLSYKLPKYSTRIFDFYNKSHVQINRQLNEKDKTKFKKLVFELILDKIQPRKFQYKKGEGSSYTLTQEAMYLGEIFKTASILDKTKAKKYYQKAIDFIPFAYYEDLDSAVKIIPKKSIKNLDFIIEVYSSENDLRYFQPTNFSRLITHFFTQQNTPPEILTILEAQVEDKKIPIYERLNILESLSKQSQSSERLEQLLLRLFALPNRELKDKANEILIRKYKQEEAILWRFQQIITRATKVEIKWGIHEVLPIEEEFHSKTFANPLFSLSLKYKKEFSDLLKFSLEYEEPGIRNYSIYIQNICLEYATFHARKGCYEGIEVLENALDQNNPHTRWIQNRLDEVKREYIFAKNQQRLKEEVQDAR